MSGQPPSRQYMVETPDLEVAVRESGDGDPVLFLHGYPFTGHFWRHQLAALSDRWRCIAIDSRGFGRTSKPDVPVTREILVRDVVNVLDALELDSVRLVGHDFGSITAGAVALRYPDRCLGVALFDAPVSVWFPRGGHGWWFKDPGRAEQFFVDHAAEYIRSRFTGRPVTYGPRPDSPWPTYKPLPFIDQDDIDHYVESFDDPAVWRHAVEYYRHVLPFHLESVDETSPGGRKYRLVSDEEVGALWNAPGDLSGPGGGPWWPVFAPEDVDLVSSLPTLFIFTRALVPEAFPLSGDAIDEPGIALPVNPMTDAIIRHFPRLQTHAVDLDHAFPEQDPELTNALLDRFFVECWPTGDLRGPTQVR